MAEFKPAFPWARRLDADQLAAFLEELWGAAGGEDDLNTLKAVEDVIAVWRRDVGDVPDEPTPCPLSERELGIVAQLAMGHTIAGAARNLGIAAETVRSRCPQIFARIGARNRAHAVVIATRRGWLPDLKLPPVAELAPGTPADPNAWNRMYRDRAAQLRRRPGVPVEIGPYGSQSGARGAARSIRKGHFDAFQPAGSFGAETVRLTGGQFAVRATFLGPTSTARGDAA